jgi:hypothetical protein
MAERWVKVAAAPDESIALLMDGVLKDASIPSLIQRAPGFDALDFLAAGPRDVLVPAKKQAGPRRHHGARVVRAVALLQWVGLDLAGTQQILVHASQHQPFDSSASTESSLDRTHHHFGQFTRRCLAHPRPRCIRSGAAPRPGMPLDRIAGCQTRACPWPRPAAAAGRVRRRSTRRCHPACRTG